MKLLFISLIVSLISIRAPAESAGEIRAATEGQRSILWQPVVGLSNFKTTGNVNSRVDGRQDLSGGLLADFGIGSDWIFFETGGLLLREGDTVQGAAFSRENTYIGFPALAKVAIDPWLNFRAGAVLAFLTSASTTSRTGSKDVSSETSPFDLQVMVGVGTAIPVVDRTALTLNFDYLHGLVNIRKSGSGQIYNDGYLITGGVIF